MQSKQKKLPKFLKLEYYRKKYGLTQNDMARLIGYCESNYNHKVNRITAFSFDDMITIRQELNKRAAKVGDPALSLDEIFLL